MIEEIKQDNCIVKAFEKAYDLRGCEQDTLFLIQKKPIAKKFRVIF
jgi:hypothetical protein